MSSWKAIRYIMPFPVLNEYMSKYTLLIPSTSKDLCIFITFSKKLRAKSGFSPTFESHWIFQQDPIFTLLKYKKIRRLQFLNLAESPWKLCNVSATLNGKPLTNLEYFWHFFLSASLFYICEVYNIFYLTKWSMGFHMSIILIYQLVRDVGRQ